MKALLNIFLFLFLAIVLILSVRGNYGSPDSAEINSFAWKEEGPFELSPERGRFALTYSMVEDNSFQFSKDLAKFASPDVAVTKDGKFASLFAPALSFITMPGYIIGKWINISQVGTFFVVALFGIVNVFLIRKIALFWGAHNTAATLGGLTFLFATPAFSYAVNLYQHHISTSIILTCIYLLLRFNGFLSSLIIFFLASLSLTLDYPNFFLLFPIGIVAFFRIFSAQSMRNKLKLSLNLPKLISIFAVILPLLFLLWFNNASFGNPFQLSGTLETVKKLNPDDTNSSVLQGSQPNLERIRKEKTAVGFFETRNLTNGLYLHFLSPDRGILFYAPVLFFAIAGIITVYRKKLSLMSLLLAVAGVNILLYSMWGDPWGGWAFGSRYLIPSYAILSIFIALLFTYWRKRIWLLVIFLILFSYSAAVNTLGAITTSAIPPQVEVLNLEKLSGIVQRYTYQRNWEFLLAGNSKSFVYQTFAKHYLSPVQYFEFLAGLIILAGLSLTSFLWIWGRENR